VLRRCRFSNNYFINRIDYSFVNFLYTFLTIYKLYNFEYYNIVILFYREIFQYYQILVVCYVDFYCIFAFKDILLTLLANFDFYVSYNLNLFVKENRIIF